MSKKLLKPRRRDGKVEFDLVVRDGNNRILDVREKKFSELDEVLSMLDDKLS